MVSILINNYNYARFLPHAIESALAQTYPAVEVIVVDDGSTDKSREVMRGFGDRIMPIFKPNGGQASAMNVGFAQAQGTYVIFLDADDVLMPDAAQYVVDTFTAHPELSKLMYRMKVIDADGEATGAMKPFSRPPTGDLQQQMIHFPGDAMWLPTSGNAFSARVLRQVLPMPEPPFVTCADFYLCHVVGLYGQVGFLEQVGAGYRLHGTNNYEVVTRGLDWKLIRTTLVRWHAVHQAMFEQMHSNNVAQLSAKLPCRPDEMGSVSYYGFSIISLKLDPQHHPFKGDTLRSVLTASLQAVARRFDATWVMRWVYRAWFLAFYLAPASVARWLAHKWLVPEQRISFVNVLLSKLQRRKN